MKKINKKGFTIVELVIVIAVIAILAAVLIPTFSSMIEKANDSATKQEADSVYKLYLAEASGTGHVEENLVIKVDTEYVVYVDGHGEDEVYSSYESAVTVFGSTTHHLLLEKEGKEGIKVTIKNCSGTKDAECTTCYHQCDEWSTDHKCVDCEEAHSESAHKYTNGVCTICKVAHAGDDHKDNDSDNKCDVCGGTVQD